MWKSVLFLALSVIPSFHCSGQSDKPFVFQEPPAPGTVTDLSEVTYFYKDEAEPEQSISEIQRREFLPFHLKGNERSSRQERETSVTWLRFALENATSDTLNLLFNCKTHTSAELFVDGHMVQKTTFAEIGRGNLLQLKLAPLKRQQFFIRVTDHLLAIEPVVAEVFTRETYALLMLAEHSRTQPLFMLLLVINGMFLLMAIFAFYNYYLVRDLAFLYYGGFALALTAATFFSTNGRFQVFDLNAPNLVYLVFVFYTLFISRIVNLRHTAPISYKIMMILTGILSIQLAISLADFFLETTLIGFIHYHTLQILPGAVTSLLCLIVTIRSDTPFRRYLTAGIACMLVIGIVPYLLNPLFERGLDRLEAIINYPASFAFLGFAIESTCFAMALAYRGKLIEEENKALERKYTADLQRQLGLRTSEIEQKSRELEERRISQLTAEFEQRVVATEMTALRAQMNPHFIFNCLNSIKLYTLENDATTASEYLTKFSRLIRLVLENSQADRITLTNELETLYLYLEMEGMRFKNRFSSSVNVAADIDQDFVEVPPMLIQPYIENAIWHGLMHKDGAGKVDVSISQREDDLLQVEITDDGVGRARAAEYKSKSATRNKSFGMKMTSERIALINHLNRNHTRVEVLDLVDPQGQALGTKVILLIPLSSNS